MDNQIIVAMASKCRDTALYSDKEVLGVYTDYTKAQDKIKETAEDFYNQECEKHDNNDEVFIQISDDMCSVYAPYKIIHTPGKKIMERRYIIYEAWLQFFDINC